MTYNISITPLFHYQVKRGDFIMAVFPTRKQAETYVESKLELRSN